MFVLFHKRVCGPLANTLFHHQPTKTATPPVKIEAAYHRAVLEAFGIAPDAYSLTQLRYDVRKLRAHALLERQGRIYAYRLTEKGTKVLKFYYRAAA